jgi:hypothetical protein
MSPFILFSFCLLAFIPAKDCEEKVKVEIGKAAVK